MVLKSWLFQGLDFEKVGGDWGGEARDFRNRILDQNPKVEIRKKKNSNGALGRPKIENWAPGPPNELKKLRNGALVPHGVPWGIQVPRAHGGH